MKEKKVEKPEKQVSVYLPADLVDRMDQHIDAMRHTDPSVGNKLVICAALYWMLSQDYGTIVESIYEYQKAIAIRARQDVTGVGVGTAEDAAEDLARADREVQKRRQKGTRARRRAANG